MNEKEKVLQNKGFKIGLVLFTVAMVSVAVIYDARDVIELPNPFDKPDAKWHTVMKVSIGTGIVLYENPAPSATDFLEIFLINLSSGDDYFCQENTSATLESVCDANGLGYASVDNSEVDIAHSTPFVILVKVQGDATHCKRAGTWWDTDLNCTLTWTSQGETDSQPEGETSYPLAAMNTSSFTYLYKMFCWDNSNSGYQIAKGSNSGAEPILELAVYY